MLPMRAPRAACRSASSARHRRSRSSTSTCQPRRSSPAPGRSLPPRSRSIARSTGNRAPAARARRPSRRTSSGSPKPSSSRRPPRSPRIHVPTPSSRARRGSGASSAARRSRSTSSRMFRRLTSRVHRGGIMPRCPAPRLTAQRESSGKPHGWTSRMGTLQASTASRQAMRLRRRQRHCRRTPFRCTGERRAGRARRRFRATSAGMRRRSSVRRSPTTPGCLRPRTAASPPPTGSLRSRRRRIQRRRACRRSSARLVGQGGASRVRRSASRRPRRSLIATPTTRRGTRRRPPSWTPCREERTARSRCLSCRRLARPGMGTTTPRTSCSPHTWSSWRRVGAGRGRDSGSAKSPNKNRAPRSSRWRGRFWGRAQTNQRVAWDSAGCPTARRRLLDPPAASRL
mmetsp:Transcript_17627/g.50739  ORF Transcript_17627/g.50739 Transcript_17627/m.50739 type:complete len:400 (-) Transcript_17627:48-1247(-)